LPGGKEKEGVVVLLERSPSKGVRGGAEERDGLGGVYSCRNHRGGREGVLKWIFSAVGRGYWVKVKVHQSGQGRVAEGPARGEKREGDAMGPYLFNIGLRKLRLKGESNGGIGRQMLTFLIESLLSHRTVSVLHQI